MAIDRQHPLLLQQDTFSHQLQPIAEGCSVQGRSVLGWWLGQQPNNNHPVSYLIGAFHGDEPEAAELVLRFLKKHHNNQTLRPTLVIPILNPDGLAANTRVNANGVDLNRNWPTQNWDEPRSEDKYFGGPEPLSEPESEWLSQLLQQYPPKLILSIHTPYREINIDGPARTFAEKMATHNHYPITEDIGYPTPGSFGTCYGKEKDIPVITLELPDWEEKKQSFEQTWLENEPALLAVLAH